MAFDIPYLSLRCPNCNGVLSEDCDLPTFDPAADSHSMDSVTVDLTCECGQRHRFNIEAFGEDYYETTEELGNRSRAFLYVPPKIDTLDDMEVFLEPPELDDPYRIFLRSSIGLLELARVETSSERLEQTLLGMLYANHIAMLEAYLSDRLISLLVYDDTILKGFILRHDKLRTYSVQLHAVAGNPHIARDIAIGFLKHELYHKLDDVEKLYRVAFDVESFPDRKLKASLADAVLKRHDFVHRNGRDKEGKAHILEHRDITLVRSLVTGTVYTIENLLDAKIRARRFYFFENPPSSEVDALDLSEASDEELEIAYGR